MNVLRRRVAPFAFTVLTLTGCATARTATNPDSALPRPGTYEISVCEGPCELPQSRRQVRGTLVVEDSAFTAAVFSDSARKYFERRTDILLRVDAKFSPTICFALERLHRGAKTHAGISPAGLTRWESRPDSGDFRVVLYHSPDAIHEAFLKAAPDGLRGRGSSRGGGVPAGSIPDDAISARWIGFPDKTVCGQAAEAAAAADAIRSRG
jgi:hypothetical protein